MRFEVINRSEIPVKTYKGTKIMSLIEEFIESDADVARIHYAEGEYKNATSAYAVIRQAIKRNKYAVTVFTANKQVYIAKINPDK